MNIAHVISQTRNPAHCPAVLSQSQVETLVAVINPVYERIEKTGLPERASLVEQMRLQGEKFVPTASSFTMGAALSEVNVDELLRSVSNSAEEWITTRLGRVVVVDLDQSWVRRQYAPGRYPPLHAPHAWHQDGALGSDFLSAGSAKGRSCSLLEMVTIWMPLDPCGTDAPGLELVLCSPNELFLPEQLGDSRVRSVFTAELFWKPVLSRGDALLFSGDILHRTHVLPSMSRDRTSIELRCFAAERIPARFKEDRFLLLPLKALRVLVALCLIALVVRA